MDATGWLRATKTGDLKCDLTAEIRVEENGHVGIFRMNTMPMMVSGQVRSAGAYDNQLVCDMLVEDGEPALLPTAKLMAAKHRQATVKLLPIFCDVVHTTAEQWGELWYQQLCHATGESGQWNVSDGGKGFMLDALCADFDPALGDARAVNDGFFVDEAQTVANAAGSRFFMGVQVYPTEIAGVWAVQERGAKHGLRQRDYSQHGFAVAGWCMVQRAGTANFVRMRTRDVYQDAELAVLVFQSGQPIGFVRQPGVPLLVDSPEWKALLAQDLVPPTLRSVPHLIDSHNTPVSPQELYNGLKDVWPDAARPTLLTLTAQWALETGIGKLMKSYNIGNIKGRPDGSDGSSYQYFACGEELLLSQALKSAQDPRVTLVRQYKRDVPIRQPDGSVITRSLDMASVHVVPDHPIACFRAYDTLDEGVADYVALLKRRFPTAVQAAVAGDPHEFSLRLGAAGYFTAPAEEYAKTVVGYFNQFNQKIAA